MEDDHPADDAEQHYYTPTPDEEAHEQTAVEIFLHEFFAAPHTPASNHEEWLLRLCAQMMHREAEVRVSMSNVSMQGGKGGAQRRRRNPAHQQREPWNNNGTTSSGASEAYTKQSMETDSGSWSES